MGTFVTVGNAHQSFVRLLKAVETIADSLPQPVIVQCGHTPFTSEKCQSVDFMTMERFVDALSSADLVITHGGATVMQAIQAGKVPVVMPRLPGQREIIDDHQVHFATAIAANGACELALTGEDLAKAVTKALARTQSRAANMPRLVKEISGILAAEAQRRNAR